MRSENVYLTKKIHDMVKASWKSDIECKSSTKYLNVNELNGGRLVTVTIYGPLYEIIFMTAEEHKLNVSY